MEGDTEHRDETKSNTDDALAVVEQPLLGSVTTFSNVEGPELKGQQIRSSARVFKKMKLDVSVPLVVEKPEKKEDSKQDIKRCYRPLWTSDDKTIFFEALNEFGKDFESIQMYLSTKLKKKGVPENLIKTKDQVRHLYYRTWHKISKYLKFADAIKKVIQELYALINYGELRKKIGSVSEKSLLKLNELIYKGITMLRIKGKNVRVKTPMCRALRRLNQLDDKYDEIKLPNKVIVELRPKDMTCFLQVQTMAQNPRIKTTLPLQKRLSHLISCVNKRWKTVEAVNYEKAITSTNAITDVCVPPTKTSEENKMLLSSTFRLTPSSDCHIEVPAINLSEYFTRQSICLNSYETRIGIANNTNHTPFYNYNNYKLLTKSQRKGHRPRTDSISDKSEKSPQKNSSHTEDNDTGDMTDNEPNMEVSKVVDEAVNTILALQLPECPEADDENLLKLEKKEVPENMKVKLEKKDIQDETNKLKLAQINNIRRGWTEKDCESLTVGEIYLMCGSESKLVLEYSWDKSETLSEAEAEQENLENTSLEAKENIPNHVNKNVDLSDSLSKLVSVAKLHYRKNMIKCPCGHVCGMKNNMQLKRAMESKIRKILTDIDKCTDEPDDKISTEDNIFGNNATFVAPPVYLQPNVHQVPRQVQPTPYYHQPTPMIHLASQLDSIQRLKPRYCNRRGRRPRSKQVVVERKLPLLPNKVGSGHQIVRMNIISQETNPSSTGEQMSFENKGIVTTESQTIFPKQDPASGSNVFADESQLSTNILGTTVFIKNESAISLAADTTAMSSAPSSPSRILKEDNQWINSEVADYSLSSLLGHLESPLKGSSHSNLTNDDSRMSQDVDAQLQSLLTENSLDFSANFADLAAQVTNELKK